MWRLIGNGSALIGIAGISFGDFVGSELKSWIALGAFCLALTFICWRVYARTRDAMNKRYKDGFLALSSFSQWSTTDGSNYTYEVFRHLQIKDAAKRFFEHQFWWSGTKEPVIESALQTVGRPEPVPGTVYKAVKLTFGRTRIYNDVEVVHLRMKIDDSDQQAKTHLIQRVHQPIRVISFRVELLHVNGKYNGQQATLTRKLMTDDGRAAEENLCKIPFDAATKTFAHQIVDPEPGYQYKLEWPRPPAPGRRR